MTLAHCQSTERSKTIEESDHIVRPTDNRRMVWTTTSVSLSSKERAGSVLKGPALLQLSCDSNYTLYTKLPSKSSFPAQCAAEGETPGRSCTNTPPKILWRWISEKLSETQLLLWITSIMCRTWGDPRWASVTVSGCVVFGAWRAEGGGRY